MQLKSLITVSMFLVAPAFAADAPKFVPFTVNEDDLKALNSQLEEMPIKMIPATQTMGRWLNGLEQKAAAAQKAADDAKATTPKP